MMRILKEKLKELNIVNKLQSRLVDDITVIPKYLKPGTVLSEDFSELKHSIVYWNTLLYAVTQYNILLQTVVYCNTLCQM